LGEFAQQKKNWGKGRVKRRLPSLRMMEVLPSGNLSVHVGILFLGIGLKSRVIRSGERSREAVFEEILG